MTQHRCAVSVWIGASCLHVMEREDIVKCPLAVQSIGAVHRGEEYVFVIVRFW